MMHGKNLSIGILKNKYYTKQLLYQGRLSFTEFDTVAELFGSDCPLIICNEEISSHKLKLSKEKFLITNHAVYIDSGKQNVFQVEKQEGYYFYTKGIWGTRSFLVEEPCYSIDTDTNMQGNIFDKENNKLKGSGIIIEGRTISLPWNIDGFTMGETLGRRPYYSPCTGKHFVEIGSKVDFGAFRRLMTDLLRYAYNKMSLPLIVGMGIAEIDAAGNEKKYFSVRIDADGYTKQSTETCLNIAVETGCAFTWFLDVEAWKRGKSCIRELSCAGQDIQLHCYHHMTYEKKETNIVNIKRALKFLGKMGIYPKGMVSPFGFYFPGFGKALEELGFEYSSEFALNVNDRPCYPENSSVLQLPIHCGSIGTLKKYGFDIEEIFMDFEASVYSNSSDGGIGVIYDHPVDRMEKYEKEFKELIYKLKKSDFEYMNYTEYYKRWSALPETFQAYLGNASDMPEKSAVTIIAEKEKLVINSDQPVKVGSEYYRIEPFVRKSDYEDITFLYPEKDIMKQAYEMPIVQISEAKQTPCQYYVYIARRFVSHLVRDVLKIRK